MMNVFMTIRTRASVACCIWMLNMVHCARMELYFKGFKQCGVEYKPNCIAHTNL